MVFFLSVMMGALVISTASAGEFYEYSHKNFGATLTEPVTDQSAREPDIDCCHGLAKGVSHNFGVFSETIVICSCYVASRTSELVAWKVLNITDSPLTMQITKKYMTACTTIIDRNVTISVGAGETAAFNSGHGGAAGLIDMFTVRDCRKTKKLAAWYPLVEGLGNGDRGAAGEGRVAAAPMVVPLVEAPTIELEAAQEGGAPEVAPGLVEVVKVVDVVVDQKRAMEGMVKEAKGTKPKSVSDGKGRHAPTGNQRPPNSTAEHEAIRARAVKARSERVVREREQAARTEAIASIGQSMDYAVSYDAFRLALHLGAITLLMPVRTEEWSANGRSRIDENDVVGGAGGVVGLDLFPYWGRYFSLGLRSAVGVGYYDGAVVRGEILGSLYLGSRTSTLAAIDVGRRWDKGYSRDESADPESETGLTKISPEFTNSIVLVQPHIRVCSSATNGACEVTLILGYQYQKVDGRDGANGFILGADAGWFRLALDWSFGYPSAASNETGMAVGISAEGVINLFSDPY